MKVIMSTPWAYPFSIFGGTERYVYFLSKYLVKEGIDVKIITSGPQNKGRNTICDGIEYEFISKALPPYGKRFWPFLYLFNINLARRLKEEKFNVLHSYHITAYFYLHHTCAPVIIEPFGLGQLCFAKLNSIEMIFREILLKRPLAYCMTHADAIAADGRLQLQELASQFKVPTEKIFILPDGVELDLIQTYTSNSRMKREDLGLQDADLVLVNVNRLDRNKGISYLIDALGILNRKINAKLIMVGAGPEETRINRQIERLKLRKKVVHFKNISDKNMFQLYTLADISVTPTLWEGLPLVVLEAMAAGKPIVATNVADIPSVIKGNGIIVPPRDEKAIVDAVFKIYRGGLIRAMGIKSKEIIKSYDWGIIAKKAIKMYEELIGKQ